MLFGFLNALMGQSNKDKAQKKLTQKEKDALDYELWVRAEEAVCEEEEEE